MRSELGNAVAPHINAFLNAQLRALSRSRHTELKAMPRTPQQQNIIAAALSRGTNIGVQMKAKVKACAFAGDMVHIGE